LAAEAILAAAGDAGLDPTEIDGLTTFATMNSQHPGHVQAALGLPSVRWASMPWGLGGGSGAGAIATAAAAVESSRARYVAVFRSLCQGPGGRFGGYRDDRPDASFNAPFGVFNPAPMVAMVIRRHMHSYGTRSEHLGRVALACRANANRNPRAIMYGRPLDMETYLQSRVIADPFRLFDCCLETDGACAVIVTTDQLAGGLQQRPVGVIASVLGIEPRLGTIAMGAHTMPAETYATGHVEIVRRELFAQASLTPDQIDVAQLYDAFTGMVLLALESYGFCGRGESGKFVDAGNIDWPRGQLPVNTAGGNLSEAYVHGLTHVVEGVRQLRGTSTTQVKDARTCLVASAVLEAPSSALILAT
jgi:acetyl-CoA acetyltransferase